MKSFVLFVSFVSLLGLGIANLEAQDAVLPNISTALSPGMVTSYDQKVLSWWNETLSKVDFNASRVKCDIPDIGNLRMVGQVVTPQTSAEQKNQEEELTWFRAQGFNGALLVWKGEPPEKLSEIARKLHVQGWVLAWTFGPEESFVLETDRKYNVYVDPINYRNTCRLILPYCAFALPVFRRGTMVHFDVESRNYPAWHRLQADQYRRVLIDLMREAAPQIPIMGETTLRSANSYALLSSTEPDTSGRIVYEAAYADYRMDKVSNFLRRNQVEEPWLFLVAGTKPYYERVEPGWDCDLPSMWKYNVATCNVINQLKQAALVLAGGGGGTRRLWDKDLSDDLTKTTWRK